MQNPKLMFKFQHFGSAFFKDFVAVVFSLSPLPLHFDGQIDDLLAVVRTASLSFFLARIALDKQQVTGLIGTIYMAVAGGTALVALRDYMLTYLFSPAFVENKVFTDKLIFQTLFIDLTCIFNDTALQLKNIFKSFMFKVSARFFTSDPSRTIH
jgi:hypothetical protein